MPETGDLTERLKSFGRLLGRDQASKPTAAQTVDIAAVVDGYDLSTAFGCAFVVERDIPFAAIQGNGLNARSKSREMMATWCGYSEISGQPPEEFLFLDTETSGLSGGSGTFVFLVGLGYWTHAGFHLIQIFLRDPAEEAGFLAGLSHFLANYSTIVTFNGKSFDIPMLNARHILNRFSSPFNGMKHIDLLPLARRLWRNRLASRALKDLEVEILNLERTDEEVPGWMIPEIYYEYLRSHDARPLANVIYHNAQDILSLGLLFNMMADLLEDPLQIAPQQGLDLIAVARLYEERGYFEAAIQLYEYSLSQGELPLPFYLDTLKRFANLYRKQDRFDEALRLWTKAADHRQVDACIEIAKYYEHRQKDWAQALQWVENALLYSTQPIHQSVRIELLHRQARLKTRLDRHA